MSTYDCDKVRAALARKPAGMTAAELVDATGLPRLRVQRALHAAARDVFKQARDKRKSHGRLATVWLLGVRSKPLVVPLGQPAHPFAGLL